MEEQDYPLPRDVIEALAACESSDSIERELQSWGLPRAIQHWSRKACETWLQAYLEDESYLNVEIPQPKADPEDFFNTYIRVQWGLFDQVLLRSSKIGIEVQLAKNEVISNLIIWGHVVIHPPRRFLVPTFLEWIDMDFVPALATYHDQFFSVATAQERALACNKLLTLYRLGKANFFDHAEADCVLRELQTAWNHAPQLVHTWCDILLNKGPYLDAHQEALVKRYQRMARDAAAGMPGLPDKTMRYLMLPHADRYALTEASIEIADLDHESCSPLLRMARNIIERDSSLHRGKLPPHIDVVSSPQAREVLQDYQRLRDMGGLSPVTACLLLTSALEIQLRFILRKVEGASKATLGELRERWSQRRSAANRTASPQYDHALENAVRIRNHAHHSPNKVCPDDADYLHRNLFEPAKEVGILAVIFRDGCEQVIACSRTV